MTNKIALITDTHWGVRNDSLAFLDNNKKFLEEIFFPMIDRLKIKTIVHLGDMLDRRKYVNFVTASRLRKDFIDPIVRRGIFLHHVAGNHDVYFKTTNEVNSVTELYHSVPSDSMKTYLRPEEVSFYGMKTLLVPWICPDNFNESEKALRNSQARFCMGHLEVSGFKMYRDSLESTGGLERSSLKRFDRVLSGHFHHSSEIGNVKYLGAHAEFTWSEYGDPRGFHVMDTQTGSLTFFENPFKMFKKVIYDDRDKSLEETLSSTSDTDGSVVKIIVKSKDNPLWFDTFVSKIEETNPVKILVVNDHLHADVDNNVDVSEAEDTITIIRKYLKSNNLELDRVDEIEQTMIDLYEEALSIEDE